MDLNKEFDKGIHSQDYMATLTDHRDAFMHIYQSFSIPKEDMDKIKTLSNSRVIVLAEPWCGHCMMDIPILLKIVEQAGSPIRFLRRDEHLDIMDQYLTDEKRFIPIFIFIDDAGNEIAKWGPMAAEIKRYVEDEKVALPSRTDVAYEAAFQAYIKKLSKAFETDATLWKAVYEDILQTIIK